MPTNFWLFFVVGLIPLVVGAIYYSEALLGKKWMRLNGFTPEFLKEGNPIVLFGSTYLLSVLIAFAFSGIVVHQTSIFQTMMPEVMEEGSKAQAQFEELMAQYGNNFRNLKHGAIHGVIFSIFFVLPLIAINALFERKTWSYIFIHVGYWLITLSIMGAVMSAYLVYN